MIFPLDPPQSITLGMAVPTLESASPAVIKFAEYVGRIGGHHEADIE